MFLAGTPAVELEGVVATIDGFPVLAGVDLCVEPGAVVLVSGANGAGKTSLLRLLAGDLRVAAGRATVLGSDLAHLDGRTHRRHVVLVGHETGCYDDLTVRRNLGLHARVASTRHDVADHHRTAEQAADDAMRRMQLDDLADVAHGRLSTGQRRRCALAVGLVRRADLVLLDEPHAGLDADARRLVDDIVADARDRGATVVLVSHELDHARPIADREVVVAGGCVVAAV